MKEPTMTKQEKQWVHKVAVMVNDTIEALKVVADEQRKQGARITTLEKKQ
jgi:hypothetical protein